MTTQRHLHSLQSYLSCVTHPSSRGGLHSRWTCTYANAIISGEINIMHHPIQILKLHIGEQTASTEFRLKIHIHSSDTTPICMVMSGLSHPGKQGEQDTELKLWTGFSLVRPGTQSTKACIKQIQIIYPWKKTLNSSSPRRQNQIKYITSIHS